MRLVGTLAVTGSAWLLIALDRLVVATALPEIRAGLGADLAGAQWVVDAYTLSFAVFLLTGAALGDRFGRRRVFAVGLTLFTVASLAAALAPTIGALVAARAVQGAGAALIAPVALTLLHAATPAQRRGTVLGAWGAIGGLGAALGPVVGGGLTEGLGWQWVFWINVPLGVTLVPLACRHLDESRGPLRPIDARGVVLSGVGLACLVWAVIRAGDGWGRPDVSDLANVANIPACPDYQMKDVQGAHWLLEITATDRSGRMVTASVPAVPTCQIADPTFQASCLCDCAANYKLGKCGGSIDGGNPD